MIGDSKKLKRTTEEGKWKSRQNNKRKCKQLPKKAQKRMRKQSKVKRQTLESAAMQDHVNAK